MTFATEGDTLEETVGLAEVLVDLETDTELLNVGDAKDVFDVLTDAVEVTVFDIKALRV